MPASCFILIFWFLTFHPDPVERNDHESFSIELDLLVRWGVSRSHDCWWTDVELTETSGDSNTCSYNQSEFYWQKFIFLNKIQTFVLLRKLLSVLWWSNKTVKTSPKTTWRYKETLSTDSPTSANTDIINRRFFLKSVNWRRSLKYFRKFAF